MKKLLLSTLAIGVLALTSCSRSDDSTTVNGTVSINPNDFKGYYIKNLKELKTLLT